MDGFDREDLLEEIVELMATHIQRLVPELTLEQVRGIAAATIEFAELHGNSEIVTPRGLTELKAVYGSLQAVN